MFYYRFKVISKEKALQKGLTFESNVYGDAINRFNCRSFWCDDNFRYRCSELN